MSTTSSGAETAQTAICNQLLLFLATSQFSPIGALVHAWHSQCTWACHEAYGPDCNSTQDCDKCLPVHLSTFQLKQLKLRTEWEKFPWYHLKLLILDLMVKGYFDTSDSQGTIKHTSNLNSYAILCDFTISHTDSLQLHESIWQNSEREERTAFHLLKLTLQIWETNTKCYCSSDKEASWNAGILMRAFPIKNSKNSWHWHNNIVIKLQDNIK